MHWQHKPCALMTTAAAAAAGAAQLRRAFVCAEAQERLYQRPFSMWTVGCVIMQYAQLLLLKIVSAIPTVQFYLLVTRGDSVSLPLLVTTAGSY